MRNDVHVTLKKCPECLIFNDNKKLNFNYPLLIGEAMERIGIDTVGPFIETERGNKFILIGIDYLTKYIFMKAVKNKSAVEVATFIYEKIILEHGCPSVILTDNGKEYNNEMVENLCNKMNIKKKYSSPYRPQTNGLIERTNKTIIGILSKNVYDEKRRWDDYIELIRFNYNIRHQDNIGCSPFELIFGRYPNLPYSLELDNRRETVEERMKRIRKCQEEAMHRRRSQQTAQIKELKEEDKLKIGDVVLCKNQPHEQEKLGPKWRGPYVVEHAKNPASYVISDIDKNKNFVVHRKNLKRLVKNVDVKRMKCNHFEVFEDKQDERQGGL